MKQIVAIDVMYSKYIEVEIPDVKGTEDEQIMAEAVFEELENAPLEFNGWSYSDSNWEATFWMSN